MNTVIVIAVLCILRYLSEKKHLPAGIYFRLNFHLHRSKVLMVKGLMSLPAMNNFWRHNDKNISYGIGLRFSKWLLIFSYRERPEKIFLW
jgi:hypothetical protein